MGTIFDSQFYVWSLIPDYYVNFSEPVPLFHFIKWLSVWFPKTPQLHLTGTVLFMCIHFMITEPPTTKLSDPRTGVNKLYPTMCNTCAPCCAVGSALDRASTAIWKIWPHGSWFSTWLLVINESSGQYFHLLAFKRKRSIPVQPLFTESSAIIGL